MAMCPTTYTRQIRRLSRLVVLLTIYGLIASSFPPPYVTSAIGRAAIPGAASYAFAATHTIAATASPHMAGLASTGIHTSVYLPLVRGSGAPTSTPGPTSTPSPTPTSTSTATPIDIPNATPTEMPSATPVPATELPTAPTNLRLSEKTHTSISLVWDASTDDITAIGYEIFNGPALVATTSQPTDTVTGLTPDTSYTFTLRAKNLAGKLSPLSAPFKVRTKRADDLPYDPVLIAPPLDQTTTSDFAANMAFLYSGPDAIQSGVAPGAIDPQRLAVLRGLARTRGGAPLPDVMVSVLGHPEYGQTQTRADGMFDLAVNGGPLMINYVKDGFLPLQRHVDAPWRDFAWLPDVVLIPLDSAVTAVTLDGAHPLQVARGSVVTDTDGVRQATLLFPQNLTATLVLPDNTTAPLTTLHVRATEYTISADGPKAMPGPLPPSSAYTYAAEFSVDEALAADAKAISFSQPVAGYVENFLGFPVGSSVPAGSYDRERAVWIPSDNGRVIAIAGVTGGLADLDTDGDGSADDAVWLGVTDAERQQLAALYSAGQQLWRVPLAHFSSWDFNWGFSPPWDATSPTGGPPRTDELLDDPCERDGSIIECQNQTLGEAITVAGTPLRLHYQSDRVAGRTAARSLQIPLSRGAPPASLDHIELEITVAGQRIRQSFSPDEASSSGAATERVSNFTWDGRDAYDRQLQGAQPVVVKVGYIYPILYRQPAGARSFGSAGIALIGDVTRAGAQLVLTQSYRTTIRSLDVRPQGLGGWTLDVHHSYDLSSRTLYLGDGGRRSAERIDSALTTAAGLCSPSLPYGGGYYGDSGPAAEAVLNRPAGMAFGPDGSLYIADTYNQRVRRVGLDGIISTVAGTDYAGFSGDGGPAIIARLNNPSDVAVGPDGSLYIADTNNQRVRRVGLDGIISTVAGTDSRYRLGEGGPATAAGLLNPLGVAVGPDGSLYIADASSSRIRRVGPDGIITTVAGNGNRDSYGDGGLAQQAGIGDPVGIALGPDGSLYIADQYNNRVRHVTLAGIITTVAGGGTLLGDGGAAIDARLNQPYRLTLGPDGSLYIADKANNRIRLVRPNGIITTVAGNGALNPIADNAPAMAAALYSPQGVALRPDGSLYIADSWHHCVRRVGLLTDGSGLSGHVIPSQDGAQLYEFDQAGRHLRTLDALTRATLFSFAYDTAGRLLRIADRDSRITTIQRDASGTALAIIGPDGQRTGLLLDSNGHLVAIANPAGETTRFEYTSEGLLTKLTDPRGGTYTFAYDENGRLARDTNPAGGFTSLARSDDDDGYTVSVTNALGDVTTMRVETLPNGDQRRVSTVPNGATTTTLIQLDGTRVITDPRGNLTTSLEGPDPRWGMQVPFVKSLTIATASGHVFYRLSATRTAMLSNPADPFSLQSQTDRLTINGRTTTTIYDATARTRTTTDPADKQTITTLGAKGRPVREEISNLAPKQYAYDAQGRLIRVVEGTGPAARTITLSYDAQGNLANMTDALGGATSYTYDLAGRILSRTLPTGHMLTFTYDAAGNRSSATDVRGARTTYEYDLHNRLVAETLDPDGRAVRTEYTYDLASNLLVRVEDADTGRLNVTTRYEYASVGDNRYAPKRVIDPLGQTTRYTYTPSGEVSSVTDPLNRTTLLTYTAQGWRSVVTTPGGRTTLTTYNDEAQVVSVTDPRGSLTTFAYDAAGRLKAVIAGAHDVEGQPAINQTLTYAYDANGRVVNIADPRGKLTTRSYDAFGRLIEERDPLGNTTSFAYDVLDRLVQRTIGGSVPGEAQQTAYEYDAAGRLLAERADPDGLNLVTRYRYTRAGSDDTWSFQEVVDPKGNVTAFHYDRLGLHDAITDALGQTWSFAYDNLGRPVSQVDPLGHADTTTFDALGRRVSLTRDNRTERWSYGADGVLAGYTDFTSRTTAFAYDADQRLIGVDYATGTADVSYTYDLADNLVSMTDGLGTTTYTYDALNRLRERTRDGRTVAYDYTTDDQLVRLDYWGRGEVRYDYNDVGRLSSLRPWGASAISYSYRGDGLLTGQTRGNGVTTTYGYDSAGRLRDLLHQRGVSVLLDIHYALDPNGNRAQLTDNDGVTLYSYDALNRLTQASYPSIADGPSAATTNYDLDPVGNRLSDGTTSFSYDPSDRISNPGYSYDANGNLLGDGTTTYAYDAANRLIQTVKGGVTTRYGYDGNGNLIRETVDGITTDFVLDERGGLPHILGEVRSNGTERLYAYGPEGIAAQQTLVGSTAQGVQYPLLDGLGSVRHLTDDNGAIILSRSYDAFGAIRYTTGAAQTSLGFTGERMGLVDGTIYLRARHYSPVLGRFLQRDSFAGFAMRSQSLNRYAYAENNPARFTDPSGRCPFCVAIAAGAIIGAGIEYGTQVYQNYQHGKSGWAAFTDVQADKIGYAALQGAVAGGVGFVAGPLLAPLAGSGMLGAVAAGALEGASAGGLGQIAINLLKGCKWDSNLLQGLLSGGLSGGLGGGLGWGMRQVGKARQQVLKVVATGHGKWTGGFTTLSKGKFVTLYGELGDTISTDIGEAIEYAVPNNLEEDILSRIYSKTFGPGSEVPDLILLPAPEFKFANGSLTVDGPTHLSELLNSFEGPAELHWATCLAVKGTEGLDRTLSYKKFTDEEVDAMVMWGR